MAHELSAGDDVSFVDAYVRARRLEGRLQADDAVRGLPEVAASDPLAGEWRLRADSCRRFRRYLAGMRGPVHLWDLGCGNGWFTARMALQEHVTAIGVDVNDEELAQARRVFDGRARLTFGRGDIVGAAGMVVDARATADTLNRRDVVVLVSALQYIRDASATLRDLCRDLPPGTEIHVLDSPIHSRDEIAAARQRTREHYARLGAPEMIDHYHHHDWSVLDGLAHDVLYRPDALLTRVERSVVRRARSPFPWIRIIAGGRT